MNPFDNSLYHFAPDKSIPRELSRQVIIVTGGNSGCGKETVLQLAKHNPRCVYLAARSKAKYDAAMKDISAAAPNANVRYLELDLASLGSVKKAANSFLSENDRLDVLVNNAGIMAHPHGVTKDGYELQFGTNYLGPAFLTYLLLPLMQRTVQSQPKCGVRIVNVSSSHTVLPRSPALSSMSSTPI
jgi:NAD(P)-dependent dehydrogenase (short-subunit alcohol dehydrogenase family)